MSSWRCPYCNQIATLLDSNISTYGHDFNKSNKDGHLRLTTQVIVCPNTKCREYTLTAWLYPWERVSAGSTETLSKRHKSTWKLKPQSNAKPLPEYVPQPIRDDYTEACLIANLSPKASATLARRCLQGMIRDFHGVVKDRLVDEIKGLKGLIDPQTWSAIDAMRNLGNIGAHMEKDINTIIDVDPDEAMLLITLIETLIDEWYVHKHNREAQMNSVIATAAGKAKDKNQSSKLPHASGN